MKELVRLFVRPNREGAYSIEKLFNVLLPYLKHYVHVDLYTLRTANKGFINRLSILQEIRKHTSLGINHITGDINFIALALNGKKTILTIHDIDSFIRKGLIRNALIRFFWLYLPLRRVKYITVISQASKARLLDEFSFLKSKEIYVIPNCLTTDWGVIPKPFNNVEPEILQIGTKENKNLPNLIKAIAPIKCRLLIVGKIDSNINRLLLEENIAYEVYDNVTDEELADLYRRCDIVTLVSKYEGFGLPIIEANATGRVVITSNVSSMPEVAGDAALLVDPNNIESIRNAVKLIINNAPLRDKLIKNGKENITRYAPETIACKYAQLYKQIITYNETQSSGLY